jgi:hypothetical protein
MVTMIRTNVTPNVTLAEVPGSFLPISQGDVVQPTPTVRLPGNDFGLSRGSKSFPGAVGAGLTTVTAVASVL